MYFGEAALEYDIQIQEAYLGDINYFDNSFLNDKFKTIEKIEDVNERSKELSKLLYDMIQNIGSTCTKAIKIHDLYKKNYKYNHIISNYCKKYIPMVVENDRIKIKKAIDMAFIGDSRDSFVKLAVGIITDFIVPHEFNFITNAYKEFNKGTDVTKSVVRIRIDQLATIFYSIHKNLKIKAGVKEDQAIELARKASNKLEDNLVKGVNKSGPYINEIVRSIPKGIISSIFFKICPVKFRSIGQALVVYKQSSKYDKFLIGETREGAKYCFDLTYAVMEDIMKVYKDL